MATSRSSEQFQLSTVISPPASIDFAPTGGYLPTNEDDDYRKKIFDLCSSIGKKLRKNQVTDR